MPDMKDIFISSNMACNAPDYNPDVLSTLTRTAEAFARVTYQGIYLIDYYRQEFLYVSDNPLFLCGHTAEEVRGWGYRFYLKHVPEKDQKMLVELNRSSFIVKHNCFWKIVVISLLTMHLWLSISNFAWL